MSDRLAEAAAWAERLHRGQVRKGTAIPYVSHLYAVAALVMEWGGDEEAVIAALLHDAVEDCGGVPTADLIRERFGDRVADTVLACSDSLGDDPALKADWVERKRAHIAKAATIKPLAPRLGTGKGDPTTPSTSAGCGKRTRAKGRCGITRLQADHRRANRVRQASGKARSVNQTRR